MSTFVWETNSTLVNHLRIRSPERDTHSLQLRLSAMLNAAELRPTALPPAAILIVRRMGRELPPVRLDWGSVRPPDAWQAAVSETLDVLARRAARPAAAATMTDADSVLFLDRSELLACLACDWLDGALLSRWWWRCLFPSEDRVAGLLRAWSESPQYVPAALQQMSRTRRVVPLVASLPAAYVPILLRAILRAFAMPELERAVDPVFNNNTPVAVDFVPGPDSVQGVRADFGEGKSHDVAPPWARWVREANSPALKLDQRVLIAVGLMLERAPQVIRAPSFAVELKQWWQAMPRLESEPASPPRVFVPQPSQHAIDVADYNLKAVGAEPHVDPEIATSIAALHGPERIAAPHPSGYQDEAAGRALIPPTRELRVSEERAEQPVTLESIDGDAPPVASPIVEMANPPECCLDQPFDGIEVETEFGGLFYLINVAIYFGYYGDFSTPAQTGIDLSLWDFLALVGRELAGDTLRDDPVWTLLATLSGRSEGQEPGHNFEPPLGQSLSTWLTAAMAQVRERLLLALELDQPDDLGAFLLRHSARLQVTPTHLDIFLSLDKLPVSIRIARLDRDPGWIPAAGRYIAFHFF
jgi:hypothetical protein